METKLIRISENLFAARLTGPVILHPNSCVDMNIEQSVSQLDFSQPSVTISSLYPDYFSCELLIGVETSVIRIKSYPSNQEVLTLLSLDTICVIAQ